MFYPSRILFCLYRDLYECNLNTTIILKFIFFIPVWDSLGFSIEGRRSKTRFDAGNYRSTPEIEVRRSETEVRRCKSKFDDRKRGSKPETDLRPSKLYFDPRNFISIPEIEFRRSKSAFEVPKLKFVAGNRSSTNQI